jgi:hypothetical protein
MRLCSSSSSRSTIRKAASLASSTSSTFTASSSCSRCSRPPWHAIAAPLRLAAPKTIRPEAEIVLELLLRHRDKLKPLQPERAQVRTLRRVVEGRRDLVHDRTRLTNRITNALKAYFPQVLEWFRDKDSAVFADFLERWPTLEAAQRARKDTLEAFFRSSNVRRAATIKRRIDAIREERPLHSDDAVTIPARMLVDALLPQLRALSTSIARFDEEIARPAAARLRALRCLARRWPDARSAPAGSLRRAARAASRRRCASEVRRNRARHRAQWQQILGPLALQLQQVLASDLRRVGSSNHPALVLGKSLLRLSPRSGRTTPGRTSRSPSSGSESSTAAGSIAPPSTSRGTSWLSRSDPLPYSNTRLKLAADFSLRSTSGRELGGEACIALAVDCLSRESSHREKASFFKGLSRRFLGG